MTKLIEDSDNVDTIETTIYTLQSIYIQTSELSDDQILNSFYAIDLYKLTSMCHLLLAYASSEGYQIDAMVDGFDVEGGITRQ